MPNGEVTTNEIMEFLQTNMVTRDEFYDFKNDTEIHFDNLEGRFGNLEGRVGTLEGRVCHIENQMVTKDYLDDKLANLGAEIGNRINQQIKRHETLVNVFAEKAILREVDLERLK